MAKREIKRGKKIRRAREGTRARKTLIVISTEGRKTEPQYFDSFRSCDNVFCIKLLAGRDRSSPDQVLSRMVEYLKRNPLESSDLAWLIVDSDDRRLEEFQTMKDWIDDRNAHKVAFSSPSFEYWLLLHFEDGAGIGSKMEIKERLSRHMPDYDKALDMRKFSPDSMRQSIDRAKKRHTDPNEQFPTGLGVTTVYKLVELLLP